MIAAVDLVGVAGVIGAVALLVTALGTLIVGIRTSRKITTTHAMVAQIDAAVNGKAAGAPTISEQVKDAVAVLPLLVKVAADVNDLKGKTL